jgi:hypothetical protein
MPLAIFAGVHIFLLNRAPGLRRRTISRPRGPAFEKE